MKRELRKELGEADYKARKELMITGAYSDRVVHTLMKEDMLLSDKWRAFAEGGE